MGGGVSNDVGDNPHRWRGRINIGVANHELFENVVLHRSSQLVPADALFLRRHNVHGHHRQHGPVHGHGHRHLFQRDAVKQDFHVLYAVDGNPCFAHIALHPGVVGVVAAMGGQVKSDGQAGLTGFEVAPVKSVGFLCR